MNEIWKDIPRWEGIYQVSNLGQVKRIAGGPGATSGRIRKPFKVNGDYLMVKLGSINRQIEHRVVHRLVVFHFYDLCPEGKETNHKNGIRTDNRLENLEWVTRSENLIHAFSELGRKPTRGIQFPQSKLTPVDVLRIRYLSTNGKSYSELAKLFQISKAAIAQVITRRSWKHVGG